MAQFVELELDQGTDFNFDLDIFNANGVPINVSSYTFSSSIRKSYYSTSVAANLTVTIVNAANGNVSLTLNAATTSNIKAGRYLFDVKQIDNVNTTTRVVEGIITINPQVTK
jgi:uncharacterized membrane protein